MNDTLTDDTVSRKLNLRNLGTGRLILTLYTSISELDECDLELHPCRQLVVGRGPQLKIKQHDEQTVLQVCDPKMSTHHFSITYTSGKWILTDEGSKNGTFVDCRLRPKAELQNGTVIGAGGSVFVFRYGTAVKRSLGRLTTRNTELGSVYRTLERVAEMSLPVHIHGETGTGKELVARELHRLSGRSGRLVAVNCGALPLNLVESELFGAEKGAFTGAIIRRSGLVREADGGTLFLDEIAELPREAQPSLLRVIQEKVVRPIGGSRDYPVDFQIISASHQSLPALVEQGTFREDLYARLRGVEVVIPPLRDRREDIGTLIHDILGHDYPHLRFLPDIARALVQYQWPRNVRELEQIVKTAAVLGNGEVRAEDLPPEINTLLYNTKNTVLNADNLHQICRRYAGNVTAIARALGTSRSQVRRLAQRFAIDLQEYREGKKKH